jgi:hypothetical protein
MKHFFTCIFLLCLLSANAQNPVSSINITMPAQMPAQISDWHNTLPPVAITAQIRPDSNRSIPKSIIESKVLVSIKNGDSKICGSYNPKTAPYAEFNSLVKNWRGADVEQLIGQACTLKPGSYTLCVQFFDHNGQALSDERCKPFTVKNDADPDNLVAYQQPQGVAPANGALLNEKSIKQPILFRWTPVVPKPKENVVYKIQVWQYEQNKNYLEAIKATQPIIIKEVSNINQAVVTDLMNSDCKPPLNCNFAWIVQAVDPKGNALGKNNGFSEPFTFKMDSKLTGKDSLPSNQKSMGGANTEFKIDSAICLKKENGQFKYHIWAHYSNGVTQPSTNNVLLNDVNPFAGYPANPNPPNNVNKLNLANNIRMKSGAPNMALTMNDILEASSGTILTITPLPASAFTPASLVPNSIHNFQFDYSTPTITPVQFTYYGLVDDGLKDKANRNARNETDSLKYPPCPCSACDEITIKAPIKGEMQNNGNGSVSFTAALSAGPKKVKRIKADLVYFDMKTEDENCLACNKVSNLFGNINTATTTNSGFSGGANTSHSAQFDAAGNVDISGGIPINFTLSIPPLVACCNATLNFCIRYTITFEDCTVCNVLECYSYSIVGCQKK